MTKIQWKTWSQRLCRQDPTNIDLRHRVSWGFHGFGRCQLCGSIITWTLICSWILWICLILYCSLRIPGNREPTNSCWGCTRIGALHLPVRHDRRQITATKIVCLISQTTAISTLKTSTKSKLRTSCPWVDRRFPSLWWTCWRFGLLSRISPGLWCLGNSVGNFHRPPLLLLVGHHAQWAFTIL